MIVIPMAGLSRRFAEAGYQLPKYMLPVGERTVFDHALLSFSHYFGSIPFLFIARQSAGIDEFIRQRTAALGVAAVEVVLLPQPTKGQAETVAFGLSQAEVGPDDPVTVFNIDTFRPGFRFPDEAWFAESDGYLEVFKGEGANWSYVGPVTGARQPLVARTTEKQPISDLCSDGLYHFARSADFRAALEEERAHSLLPELYVAPLYNHLIARGARIHYQVVSAGAITLCGIPSEYEAAVRNPQFASG